MSTFKYERRRKRLASVSKDMPEEILFEIFARLPVKTLVQLRCLCKSWNALISSEGFINAHLERNPMKSPRDCLLVQTNNIRWSLFRAKKESLELELPISVSFEYTVQGSLNGVICISEKGGGENIYLWNPSIRKLKRLPQGLFNTCPTATLGLGFGIHCEENDYKVVKIVESFGGGGTFKFEVEIYSLRLDSWRKISAVPSIFSPEYHLDSKCAYLNGVMYWIYTAGDFTDPMFILSFDMSSEVFQKIMLIPNRMFNEDGLISTSIQVFEKALYIFHETPVWNGMCCLYNNCDIWVLAMGTWKSIGTIRIPQHGRIKWPFGYTTSCGVFIQARCSGRSYRKLVLCDPTSEEEEEGKDTGVQLNRFEHRSYMDYYRESLILLNA